MFFETATGAPVAHGGLSPTEFDGQPEVEVGWTVTPERWGEGLATGDHVLYRRPATSRRP